MIVVVMGVAGSGKTTVGHGLAGRLGWEFLEGDSLHPPENVAKMQGGTPLDDADRWPWLQRIAAALDAWRRAGRSGIVTCSALKRAYRAVLVGGHRDVRLVYLRGARPVVAGRLAARRGHFMPPALLDSQLATLEEPSQDENPVVIDVGDPPSVLVERLVAALVPPVA